MNRVVRMNSFKPRVTGDIWQARVAVFMRLQSDAIKGKACYDKGVLADASNL